MHLCKINFNPEFLRKHSTFNNTTKQIKSNTFKNEKKLNQKNIFI